MKNRSWSLLKKRLASTVALVLAGAMIIGSTVSAKTLSLKDTFDAKYYSETYGDLNTAFGTDEDALYKHYLEYGQKEERLFTTLIDLKKYRAAYADLDAAFGDNWDAYLKHYFEYGYNEGRESFGTFDAKAYADRYADLKLAFGYDVQKLYRHYLEYGRKEGRNPFKAVPVASASSSASQDSSSTTPEENPGTPVAPTPVRTVGRLLDPETGEAVARATVTFTRIGDIFTTTASDSDADTASDSDATVSSGDVVIGEDGTITVTTDENGNYVIPELPSGRYSVEASAPNYMTLTLGTIAVTTEGAEFSMPTFQLLSADMTGANPVTGEAIDAVTGTRLANVTLKVRSGWNNYEGETIATATTDANGRYSIEVVRGYYTIEFCLDGYTSVFVNVFSSNATRQFDGTMNPSVTAVVENEFRVVLTWGESPRDLDSHLVAATVDGESYYHVYFGNKQYRVGEEIKASLDVDDVTSYGPETITVFEVDPENTYYYSVYDFTNGSHSSSTAMSASEANVKVYQGSTLVREYNVPTSREGTVWNVFKIVNGSLIDLNNYSSDYNTMYGHYYPGNAED